MLRVAELNVAWPTRDKIAHVMQRASALPMAIGAVSAMGARTSPEVSAAVHNLGFGQLLDAGDAFRGIGQMLSHSRHGKALLGLLVPGRKISQNRSLNHHQTQQYCYSLEFYRFFSPPNGALVIEPSTLCPFQPMPRRRS